MRGDRSRNEGGELRQKRGDTHVGTIEQQYGRDFVRSDTRLDTLLQRERAESLGPPEEEVKATTSRKALRVAVMSCRMSACLFAMASCFMSPPTRRGRSLGS